MPGDKEPRVIESFQTKVVKSAQDPVWNEVFELYGYKERISWA
jgi:hypothetical protein